MPPRTSTRASHIDHALFSPSTTHVFVRDDARRPPLYPAYKGPYRILARHDKYFELDYRTSTDKVSIDRLKPAVFTTQTLSGGIPLAPHYHDSTSVIASSNVGAATKEDYFSAVQQMPPTRQTLRGREVRIPTRFRDYLMWSTVELIVAECCSHCALRGGRM